MFISNTLFSVHIHHFICSSYLSWAVSLTDFRYQNIDKVFPLEMLIDHRYWSFNALVVVFYCREMTKGNKFSFYRINSRNRRVTKRKIFYSLFFNGKKKVMLHYFSWTAYSEPTYIRSVCKLGKNHSKPLRRKIWQAFLC